MNRDTLMRAQQATIKRAHDAVADTAYEHTEACHRLHKLVHDAMADGAPARELAELLGVHRQRIYHYQREHRARAGEAA